MPHECPSCYGNHGVEMHDAKTGQIIWSIPGLTSDIGRGVTMDIDPRYAGSESWASAGGIYSAAAHLLLLPSLHRLTLVHGGMATCYVNN